VLNGIHYRGILEGIFFSADTNYKIQQDANSLREPSEKSHLSLIQKPENFPGISLTPLEKRAADSGWPFYRPAIG